MDWLDELSLNLNARNAVINLVTSDEAWASLRRLAECHKAFPAGHGVYATHNAGGIIQLRPGQPAFDTSPVAPAGKLLARFAEHKGPLTLVVRIPSGRGRSGLWPFSHPRNLAEQLPGRTPRADIILITQERLSEQAGDRAEPAPRDGQRRGGGGAPHPGFLTRCSRCTTPRWRKAVNPTPLQRKIVETALGL